MYGLGEHLAGVDQAQFLVIYHSNCVLRDLIYPHNNKDTAKLAINGL